MEDNESNCIIVLASHIQDCSRFYREMQELKLGPPQRHASTSSGTAKGDFSPNSRFPIDLMVLQVMVYCSADRWVEDVSSQDVQQFKLLHLVQDRVLHFRNVKF